MGKVITWEQLGTPDSPESSAAAPQGQPPSAPQGQAPSTQPSVPISPPESGKRTITFDQLGTPPEGYEPPGILEDLPSAALSGVEKGGMSFVGLPGSVGYYVRAGSGALSDLITGSEEKKLEVQRAEEEGLTREQRQSIAEGKSIPVGGGLTIPTMLGASEIGRQYLPGYDYEPSTKTGEIVQSGAQMGTESLVGGPRGAARRFLTGFGAGAGADVAGDFASAITYGNPKAKMVGDIVGAVAADFFSHKVVDIGANLGFSNKKAYEELYNAIAIDMAKNPELREKLRMASETGEPVYVSDLVRGDAANSLLRSKYSDNQINALSKINNTLKERRDAVQNSVDQKFSTLFGRDLRDDTYQASLEKANKMERDKLYTDMKNLPGAGGIASPELERLTSNNKYIREAAEKVQKLYKDGGIDPSWDVVPPMHGFPPNIQYWDVVKRSLDDVIEKASKGEGENAKNIFPAASAAKESLVKELDKILPEYGKVRNEAAEMFGKETSLEAGYELGRKVASGSPFETGKFLKAFDKLSPEQKETFAEGAARFAMQKAKGNMNGLIDYMENENVRRTMTKIMGSDRFDALYAKAISGKLASSAQDFAITESGNVKKIATLAGETLGGAAGLGLPAAVIASNPSGAATAGAAVAGALAGIALNSSERRVANKIVELAFSTKAEDAQKFAKLLSENYDAVSAVRKIDDYLKSATQKGILAYINSQSEAPRITGSSTPGLTLLPPMNTGGRVARKSGGRASVNPISAEVKRVRALLSEKTASMLSVPDDAIATALHIAKRT